MPPKNNIGEHEGKPRLGLCMIVKNEEHVIKRALLSAKDHIDTWVIVDTGSTDRTMDIIRETLDGIPGFIEQQPWVNFGHNRTQAFELCRGRMEWALVMDADDSIVFKGKPPVQLWDKTAHDAFRLEVIHGSLVHWRPHVFRIASDWVYRGALHEYAELRSGKCSSLIQTRALSLIARTEGARSQDPQKYRKDAEFLTLELAKNPGESRLQFYLAQSYMHALMFDEARANYEKRLKLDGGYEEEKYICNLELTRLNDHDPEKQIQHALQSIEIDPSRLEAVHSLLLLRRVRRAPFDTRTFAIAHLASILADREVPVNKLFVVPSIYLGDFDDEFCVSSMFSGHPEDGLLAARRALANVPEGNPRRPRLESNVFYAESDTRKMIEADAAAAKCEAAEEGPAPS